MSDIAVSLLGKWHGDPLVSIILQVVVILQATPAPHKNVYCTRVYATILIGGIISGIASDTQALPLSRLEGTK